MIAPSAAGPSRRRRQHNLFFCVSTGAKGRRAELVVVRADDTWKELSSNVAQSLNIDRSNISNFVLTSNYGETLTQEIITISDFWDAVNSKYNEDTQFLVKLNDSGRSTKFVVAVSVESSSLKTYEDPFLSLTVELEYLCSLDDIRRTLAAARKIPRDSITGFAIFDHNKSANSPILASADMFWKAADLMDRDGGDKIVARVADDALVAILEEQNVLRYRATCKKVVFVLESSRGILNEFYIPLDSTWEEIRRASVEALELSSECSLQSIVLCNSNLDPVSSRITSADVFWSTLNTQFHNGTLVHCMSRLIEPDAQTLFFEYCGPDNGHISLPKVLKRGVDINALCTTSILPSNASSVSKTGLQLACIANKVDVVSELCGLSGLHINEADDLGLTALHFACISGNGKVISLLLQHGANLGRKSKSSKMPLHYFAASDSISSKEEALAAIVKTAKSHDVNAIDDSLSMPIHYACARNDIEMVRCFISCGAVVNSRNDSGSSPLTIACSLRNFELVKLLILEGANVDARNNECEDSMIIATRLGEMRCLEFLARHNAKLDTRDKESNSLYHLSLNLGFEEQANWFLSRGIDFPILSRKLARLTFQYQVDYERRLRISELDALKEFLSPAIIARLKPVVEVLDSIIGSVFPSEDIGSINESSADGTVSFSIAARPDVSDSLQGLRMKLLKACAVGDVSTVRDLWNSNQELESRMIRTSSNDTLLHVAATIGCVELCEFLCLRGVGVNLCNNSQQTPLHVACSSGNLEIVRILVASGSLITCFDDKMCSPLHTACKNKRIDIVLYFANLFTEPFNIRDSDGILPLQYLISMCSDSPEAETLIIDVLSMKGDEEMIACNVPELLSDAITFGMKKVLKYLLKHHVQHIDTHSSIDGLNPLHRAIKRGQMEHVKLLSRFGANFTVRSKGSKQTPLLMCAAMKRFDIMKYLISILPDYLIIEDCDAKGDTCLHICARVGDIDAFAWLLSRGADIKRQNHNGQSPLDAALDAEDVDIHGKLKNLILNYTLSRPDQPQHSLVYDASLIYKACHGSFDAFLHFLSSHPLEYVSCDRNGITPLHIACENNDFAAVNLLIEHGHPLSIVSKRGESPLSLAILNENLGIVRSLLNAGAKWRDPIHDTTLLHLAVFSNSADVMRLLLDYGFPIEATNAAGTTAIIDACQQGSLKICQLLHEYGADIETRASGSPLHEACSIGNLGIVEWLLDNNIDPHAMHRGRSAFVDACSSGNTELVRLLYSRGLTDVSVCSTDDGMNGLHWACRLGNEELCRFLVSKNIELDARNKAVESALSIALHACNDNIIHIIEEKILLGHGENRKFSSDLINELYCCLQANNFPVGSYILRLFIKRIPFDSIFPGNISLLHFAAALGDEDIIQLLVSNNLNPNYLTDRGRTPLHYAASGGHLSAAIFLVSLGADPSLKDHKGLTCGDLARIRGDLEFYEWSLSLIKKPILSSIFANFACIADVGSPTGVEFRGFGGDIDGAEEDGGVSEGGHAGLWSEIEALDHTLQSSVHRI